MCTGRIANAAAVKHIVCAGRWSTAIPRKMPRSVFLGKLDSFPQRLPAQTIAAFRDMLVRRLLSDDGAASVPEGERSCFHTPETHVLKKTAARFV
jgi:hypothetical protein